MKNTPSKFGKTPHQPNLMDPLPLYILLLLGLPLVLPMLLPQAM